MSPGESSPIEESHVKVNERGLGETPIYWQQGNGSSIETEAQNAPKKNAQVLTREMV